MDQNGRPMPADLSAFPRAVRALFLGAVALFVAVIALSLLIGLLST